MLTTTTREMQEILAIDPLVGDTACQNRAVYLAYLARKVRRNKPLNSIELEFIENCRVLTEVKDTQRNEFGVITSERSKKLEALNPAVFPDNVKSNTSKNTYLSQKRRVVAEQSLAFLINKTKGMTFFAPLLRPANPPATLPMNNVPVPVLPFYLSLKMMLNIVNRKAIDIMAVVTRVQGEGDDCVLLGKAMVLYSKRDGRYQAMRLSNLEADAPLIKEAIKVEFVSKVKSDEKIAKDCREALPLFNKYLSDFMEKDILKLILLYGGNHDLYPNRTKINGDNVFKLAPEPLDESMLFNLDVCSLAEYAELKRMADEAPITRDGDYVDHVSTTSRPIRSA
jgi:hypothetical protein